MLSFKKIFRNYISFVLLGCLITGLISLGTVSGLGDPGPGTASYLSGINKRTGKDILVVSHSDYASAFSLPGAQYDMTTGSIGVSKSFVMSEITENTTDEHAFSMGETKLNLNLVSYVTTGYEETFEDFIGLTLIKGEYVKGQTTSNTFYISERTADFFLDNNPSLDNYDDLLKRPIQYNNQSFTILGIFSSESSTGVSLVFETIMDKNSPYYSDDFIIAPYYLMNGGFFSFHNSFVISLSGNESVFYHYLNRINADWKPYKVSTNFYKFDNGGYSRINQNKLPLAFYYQTWIVVLLPIVSLVLLTLTCLFIRQLLLQSDIEHPKRVPSYYCLVVGMIISSIILQLLNGRLIGPVFLYFCNYLFVIFEIAFFIGFTLLCVKTTVQEYNKDIYYSIEI